ncbi:branched-chain amino acid ABC transporter permease [Acuticoccus mangrovi]|uniref:Branched-chain amino acid ABC transporter permease n=1 Tax=Acuticoccus mangrovi TaxID=2796142 RepID=A0A934INS3_9HYPH|nr:branched-chain amino acid ABC transporter permease [Acuticoccus mangrovi]MBJ3775836.1 branched-chain amino acid ABC transporter permease [Acuticoccus mangrovi]
MADTTLDPATMAAPQRAGGGPSMAAIVSPLLFFALFAGLPFLLGSGDTFVLTIASRILIMALAAMSLDLILGYGAMVSFGHAAFIGIGAYVIGIASEHGMEEIAITLPMTLAICGAFALLMGAVSVRTSGIQFIMITLAIGQMAYFGATSLARYGGDDGLTLWGRSLVFDTRLLGDTTTLYYVILATLAVCYVLLSVIVASRFGRVLRGINESEKRMEALGYPVDRFRLTAFVIAGAICGVAGILLANLTEFVSPAYMTWDRSADLIIILVIGGLGRLHGALWGALVLLGLEEAIPWLFSDILAPLVSPVEGGGGFGAWWQHVCAVIAENWRVILGPILVLVALYARGGLVTLLGREGRA